MSAEQLALFRKVEAILFPHAKEKRDALAACKFAHYSSAEAALNIIHNKELWLRDPRCMNDYSEVRRGLHKVHGLLADNAKRKDLISEFDECIRGAAQDAIDTFYASTNDTSENTFITCFSQHDTSAPENNLGRLSMWRAYSGQQTGVAIIFDIPMDRVVPPISVFFSPVAYLNSIDAEFDQVMENVRRERAFLQSLGYDVLSRLIYSILLMASVALKHPGFEEEKEWRLVYAPYKYKSDFVLPATEPIRGIPQNFYRLQIGKLPEVEFSSLIHRIIIGPTNFSDTIKAAFISKLEEVGVKDARAKVVTSDIPLRT